MSQSELARNVSALLAIVALPLVVACGRSATTSGSPAAPTGTPGSTGQSIRIRGTVLSRSSAVGTLSLAAASTPTLKPVAGVQVRLVGSGRSVVTDSQGHFTIDSAPAGRNTLEFEGRGNHSNLDVDLHEGTVLHLAVELNGENVNLACEIEEPEGSNHNGAHTPDGGTGLNACDQGDQNDGSHETEDGIDSRTVRH